MRLILFAAIASFLGCAQQDLPQFPAIEGCRIVWSEAPYCRCVNFETGDKTSYAKEECNFSLRPGDWSKVEDYIKELERKVKKSYKKPLAEVQSGMELVNDL